MRPRYSAAISCLGSTYTHILPQQLISDRIILPPPAAAHDDIVSPASIQSDQPRGHIRRMNCHTFYIAQLIAPVTCFTRSLTSAAVAPQLASTVQHRKLSHSAHIQSPLVETLALSTWHAQALASDSSLPRLIAIPLNSVKKRTQPSHQRNDSEEKVADERSQHDQTTSSFAILVMFRSSGAIATLCLFTRERPSR